MSSSKKTEYMGLNNWLGTDRPQRIDFVDDNQKIDSTMKSHASNTTLHCTSTEKAKFNNPFTFVSYVGTGTASKTVPIGYVPKMVIVFQKDKPAVETDSDGTMFNNMSVVAKGSGNTGGAIISDSNVVVYQSGSASNNIKQNLNRQNGQYCIIAFK